MSPMFELESLEKRQLFSSVVTEVLIREEFNRGNVANSELWHRPAFIGSNGSTFLGRTQLRTSENESLPPVSGGSLHLQIDSYNRTSLPGLPSFYGNELISNRTFVVGTGLDFTVRAKLNFPMTGGIVGGLFLYTVNTDGTHDEIDTELLSNQLGKSTQKVLTNVYSDEGFGRGTPVFSSLPLGSTLSEFHTYQMQVDQESVRWYIDGRFVRVEKNVVPDGPFGVRLNVWAPASDWPEGYNGRFQPTLNPRANRVNRVEIDRVIVRHIANVTPPTPVEPGIKITSAPPLGSTANLFGRVDGLNLSLYDGVAGYIKVGGDVNSGWWTKPFFNSPLSLISSNGTWSIDVTTGGNDTSASELRAYLVPNGFVVPLSGGGDLPESLSSLQFAKVVR